MQDASDALSSVTGQEIVQALGRVPETSTVEPALPPATLKAPASPARECNPTSVLNSEVFEEKVSDIAQVHCELDLFELELTDHPPFENVKGNLRRKLEFWKRIGTSEFILNVIEREHTLPFRNQLYLEIINHPLPLQNLSRMLYVSYLSRVVLLKLSYLHWWLIRRQFSLKPLANEAYS